jgi:hypothetical protein
MELLRWRWSTAVQATSLVMITVFFGSLATFDDQEAASDLETRCQRSTTPSARAHLSM